MAIEPKSSVRARREQRERFLIKDQVLITEVVGSVMPSDSPDAAHPLQAAFEQIAETYASRLNDEPICLTFDINGYHFHIEGLPPRGRDAVDEPTAY